LKWSDHRFAILVRIHQDKTRVRRFKIDADSVRLLKVVKECFSMVSAVGRPGLDMHLGLVIINFCVGRFHSFDKVPKIHPRRNRGLSRQDDSNKKD
jgi:hypothetical protein